MSKSKEQLAKEYAQDDSRYEGQGTGFDEAFLAGFDQGARSKEQEIAHYRAALDRIYGMDYECNDKGFLVMSAEATDIAEAALDKYPEPRDEESHES